MTAAAARAGIPVRWQRIGSMFCGYFTDREVHRLSDAMHSDRERFARFFHGMLEEGIYIAPSQFEAGFLSTAHTEADIDATIAAAGRVLSRIAGS
jgi:glutamate-1-semialdehyde 2,1-aminomutase